MSKSTTDQCLMSETHIQYTTQNV